MRFSRKQRQAAPVHVLFALTPDEDGWPPYKAEEIDGTLLPDGTVQIDSPPAFQTGVAVGDTVKVREDAEGLWAEAGVTTSGHSTLRLLGRHGRTAEIPGAIAADHGCTIFATPIDIMLAVDMPPEVDYERLHAALVEGQRAEAWELEEGSLSPIHLAQVS